MLVDSGLGVSSPTPHTAVGEFLDARAAEAIQSVEGSDAPFRFSPVRGILNAVIIGAGAWTIIFATVVLTRAVL
jgi:hypothetical protein